MVVLAGCDIPSSGPDFKTETTLSSPVVSSKTFTFVGGPQSENEPLIDTTSASFDSLLATGPAAGGEVRGQVFLEQEVSDFDIGELDGALDQAASDLAVDTTLSEQLVAGSDVARQDVASSYVRSNRVDTTGSSRTTTPVPPPRTGTTTEIGFPVGDLLELPDFGVADAEQGATLESVTLTGDSRIDASTPANRLTFTLSNDGLRSLTNGTPGEPPEITLVTEDGSEVGPRPFDRVVGPGETAQAALEVQRQTLGEDTQIRLTVDGVDRGDVSLDTETAPLLYREATLGNASSIAVDASQDGVATRGGGSSRFVGIIPRNGGIDVVVRNDQQFPIVVERIAATNRQGVLRSLPADFPETAFDQTEGPRIPAGETRSIGVDLVDDGIGSEIDVLLRATVPEDVERATLAAGDAVDVGIEGTVQIGTMYFRPDGEVVSTTGVFEFNQNEVRFPSSDNFIQLESGSIRIQDLESDFGVGFQTFSISYPNLREPPYSRSDSVSLVFEGETANPPEFQFRRLERGTDGRSAEAPMQDLRVIPVDNELTYRIRGVLEETDAVRSLRYTDAITTTTGFGDYQIDVIDGAFTPFSVNVTPNPDGNDRLDVAEDDEVETASFGDLENVANRLTDLDLVGSQFTFSITTNLGADASVIAALRGTNSNGEDRYLAGRRARSAAPADTLTNDFREAGSRVPVDDLLQLRLDAAPQGETVTRTTVLTNENSNVDAFISALPTRARFASQALIGPESSPRFEARLATPLRLDAGLNLSVPLRFRDSFALRDTLEADFSSLSDVTEPGSDVQLDEARLILDYANNLPVGLNLRLRVVDAQGNAVVELPSGEETDLQVEPAPKSESGTAESESSGQFAIDLDEDQVRALSEGRTIRLRVAVDQQEQGGLARLRASDTIEFTLRTDLDGTVTVN